MNIITFNQIATNLSLKDPRSFTKKMDYFFIRKLIQYFKLYTTEQSVNVQHLQDNIKL